MNTLVRISRSLALAGALPMLLVACGESVPACGSGPTSCQSNGGAGTGGSHATDDVFADACEHLANGPIEELTAASAASDQLPLLEAEHTRFDVSLPGDTTHEGYVRFGADEAGEFWILAGSQVPLEFFQNDVPLTPEESLAQSAECAAVGAGVVYDLGPGAYPLKIGPTSLATISLVVLHADHEH